MTKVEEYSKRITDLANTVNGRIKTVISAQARSSVGEVLDGTTITNIPATPENRDKRKISLEQKVIRDFLGIPGVIIWVVPTVTYREGKAGIVIATDVRLYSNDKKSYTTIASDPIFFTTSKSVKSFNSLKKFLSQTTAGSVSSKFSGYLANANATLKKMGKLQVERAVVVVLDNMLIDKEVDILYLEADPSTDTVNTTTTTVPLPELPRPEVPTVPTPPDQPTVPEVPTEPPTPTKKGFLDIEAVDDDTTQLLMRDESSVFFNPILSQDTEEDLLTRDSSSSTFTATQSSDLSNISTTEPVEETAAVPPGTDIVAKNQYDDILKTTKAQQLAESSDALVKEKVKVKSQSSPAGASAATLAAGGREQASEESPNKPEKKPVIKPKAKYFREWAVNEGKDSNGIIYRGTKSVDYTKGTKPKTSYGLVFRYKNLFNWGSDLSGIFSGHQPASPIDVALLMNSGAIGRFNKNWPYLFEEGSEIHLAMTKASNVSRKSEGGMGDFNAEYRDFLDANWASNPHWCGLCTNFMLYSNGKYKADSALVNITSTAAIETLYSESPFNVRPKPITKQRRKQIESEIDNLQADTTNVNQDRLNALKSELAGETIINPNNACVLLERGYHWNESGLMTAGVSILNMIREWPGGFIVRRENETAGGHVETLLHIDRLGGLYTIGGNTGLTDSDGNGSEYGFKKYSSIHEFCGKTGRFYIYKRGTAIPYTNGIGVSVKKTETFNKYVKDLDSDSELSAAAFNVLKDIMET